MTPKSKFVGSCLRDTEIANGSEQRRVLEEKSLYAVSTFTSNCQATWWCGRARHHGRRIDYVAVSGDWRDMSANSTTLPAIQSPGESIDHVPVRVSMLWPQFSSDGKKHGVSANDTLVLDSWLQNNTKYRDGFSTTPLLVFLNCAAWLSVI